MESENRHNGNSHQADEQQSPFAMMAGAQERIKAGVGKAAEAMPDAMASAQSAARDTQRRLDSMSERQPARRRQLLARPGHRAVCQRLQPAAGRADARAGGSDAVHPDEPRARGGRQWRVRQSPSVQFD